MSYKENRIAFPLHRYVYLWAKCQSKDVIVAAWKKLRKGKTKRGAVIRIENNFDYYVAKVQSILRETRPGVDEKMMFTPKNRKPKHIKEHGKMREIYAPAIMEQWIHHIIVQVLSPIVMKFAYIYSCGSMPGRGGVYGKKVLAKYIKKHGFKYYTKLDIRHFFNSVKIRYVIRALRRYIDDDWFFFLLRRCFLHFPNKLPLGYYLSQWLANFVLHPIDCLIKSLKPEIYIRYVDDFVIGSDNKIRLQWIVKKIEKKLHKMHLRLKKNHEVMLFHYIYRDGREIGRFIDFMGFRFYRNRTTIRRRLFNKINKYIRKIKKLPFLSAKQAQSAVSRCGWFKHTNTKRYFRNYIRDMISIENLKGIVSKHDKEETENVYDSRRIIFEA